MRALALAYLVNLIERENILARLEAGLEGKNRENFINLKTGIFRFVNAVLQSPFLILMALAGLAAITITGALGGAVVYGPNIDPVVSAVYRFFGP